MNNQQNVVTERPYFLWDYDLSYDDVRTILRGDDLQQRYWLVGRIIEYAAWEDIWKFLTVADIQKALPHLRIRKKIKEIWEVAIARWTADERS